MVACLFLHVAQIGGGRVVHGKRLPQRFEHLALIRLLGTLRGVQGHGRSTAWIWGLKSSQ